METGYLADCPEHVPTLAAWFLDEWGFFVPDATVEAFAARLQQHLNRQTLPIAFVAREGDQLLGSASLRRYDMDTRRELTPWLGGVFVAPPYRNRGVGSELVRLVETKARELTFATLYLFTFDKETFYARRGWQLLERTRYPGACRDGHEQGDRVMLSGACGLTSACSGRALAARGSGGW